VPITFPLAQQLPPRAPLDATWQARLQTSTWQITNLTAQDTVFQIANGDLSLDLAQQPELPGYILFDNQPLVPLADDRAGMVLKTPVNQGRDLYEINFTTAGSATTLIANAFTLAPA
jgi:hypothetical protein